MRRFLFVMLVLLAQVPFVVASVAQEAGAPPTLTPPPDAPPAVPPAETAAPAEPPAPVPAALPEPTPPPPPESAAPEPVPTPVPAPAPDIPVLPRTPPRDTSRLVTMFAPLTEWGFSLEYLLTDGIGRFPVAGYAHYSDDWLAPRYTPSFHLHRGLDIFADFWTPVRAPDAGVVSRFSDSYPGGTSVRVRTYDGTVYYFGHLMARAEGLEVGQSVEVGTLLGYVGNTGNAEGGAPHLHFEIRRDGVQIPPKPVVDAWLDEAELAADEWIETRRLQLEIVRGIG